MSRRTFITILIGVLFAALMAGLWWWFFAAGGAPGPSKTGTFGSGGDRTNTSQQTNTTPTNIPNPVPGQTAGSGGVTGYAGGTVTSGTPGNTGINTGNLSSGGVNIGGQVTGGLSVVGTIPGGGIPADWLAGGPTSTRSINSGSGTPFTPAAINQLNDGQVGGSVNVLGTFNNPNSGSSGSGSNAGAIIGIAGTAVACSAFLVGGAAGLSSAALTSVRVDAPTDNTKNFMDCLARTIAKAAIQQITNSVVNWINSGFNGSPSFITNYQQFFASVADQAAGEFIANVANFAPYCTPFQTQIRVALAQSYARRNSAPSCTLSKLLGTNTQTLFGGGNSSAKTNGWSNLLQFTTIPSNNPYGAYMSAQVGLQNSINSANTNANRNITPNGFLNFQQPYDCQNPSNNGGGGAAVTVASQNLGYSCPSGCKCRTTTPGSVIESSLNKTLGTSLDSLNLAKSFDEIISALITQLMTRALYNGVSNLSGTSGYSSYYLTPDQQQAQSLGQEILTEMQGLVVVAQQYGQAKQGTISDIQSTQQQLNNTLNCWQTAASSTQDSSKEQQALDQASSTSILLHSYDTPIVLANTEITRANGAVAWLQNEQTKTLNIGSTADVSSIRNDLNAAEANGQLLATADVTQAQQDRAALQTQLSGVNQQAQTGLSQCNAFMAQLTTNAGN
jgi:hypothetical protein